MTRGRYLFNNKLRRAFAVAFVVLFVTPSLFFIVPPHTAKAQFVDPQIFTKEWFLDSIAMGIAKMAINRLTISMVQWVRSGYDGKPSFLSNPTTFFRDVANQATGVFINEIGANQVLCKPWEFGVKFALTFQKPYLIKAECTLLDAVANFEKMSENFMAAGWQGFFDITVKQENNPYGAFLQAQSELAIRVGEASEKQKTDFTLGRGFFSVTKTGECLEFGETEGEGCVRRAPDTVVTPGSYMADAMSGIGLSPLRQAELADELNESFSVIVGEMFLQAINPNRGLANIDTVPLEDANRAFSSQTTGRLEDAAAQRINDITAARDTKDTSLATIQNTIYPIYQELIGTTIGIDPESAPAGYVTGCMEQSLAISATNPAVQTEIANHLTALVMINAIEQAVKDDITQAGDLLFILQGLYSELTSGTTLSPERLETITNEVNGSVSPRLAPSGATSEYNDLVSKRTAAQTALDACQAAITTI